MTSSWMVGIGSDAGDTLVAYRINDVTSEAHFAISNRG
ncbi:hypothetical protein HDF17_002239 [Granulicella arctica]|uniref:Uncharacterized protein n=1 Tax=Granulicella arctica TaxID=940613 RepID=A0A7Y9PHM5_9BACT|nr:hypothetical protein [Granulicella arctica]